MSVTVLLSAQQLSKVTENDRAKSSRLTEHRAFKLKVRLGSMVYEGWLGSVRCSSNLSSVRFDARYFEPSPLLGSINLEPISSQIERFGIDCHLWKTLKDLEEDL